MVEGAFGRRAAVGDVWFFEGGAAVRHHAFSRFWWRMATGLVSV